MDTGGKRLAEILMRHGLLSSARPPITSPTSPPAPGTSAMVRATPPQLPPFQLSQDSLPPMQDYMPSAAPPAAAPAPQQAAPMPQAAPPMPPPMDIASPGAIAPQDIALAQALQQAQQQAQQRKLLPEQWRGSFGNQYGEPA